MENTNLIYGDSISVDFAGLPAASQLALAQRGLTHIMGNEVSSKITTAKAKAKDEGKELSDSDISDLQAKYQEEALVKIENGTLGVRTGGPKLRGLDKIMRDVALEYITAWAAKNGKKLPSGKGAAEKLAVIVANYMGNESRAAAVKTEAEARFATQQASAESGEGFSFE